MWGLRKDGEQKELEVGGGIKNAVYEVCKFKCMDVRWVEWRVKDEGEERRRLSQYRVRKQVTFLKQPCLPMKLSLLHLFIYFFSRSTKETELNSFKNEVLFNFIRIQSYTGNSLETTSVLRH